MAKNRICSIPDCGKPTKARGWCNSHWLRWTRHGDPLGGARNRDAAQAFYLEVVLPYVGDECLFWPFDKYNNGYGRLGINGRRGTVSRMACEEVYGPPPDPSYDAAHNCGRGQLGCVNPRHLVWKTRAENLADKVVHGTDNRGEKGSAAKISNDTAAEIKRLLALGVRNVDICRTTGASSSIVEHIKAGRSWAWL